MECLVAGVTNLCKQRALGCERESIEIALQVMVEPIRVIKQIEITWLIFAMAESFIGVRFGFSLVKSVSKFPVSFAFLILGLAKIFMLRCTGK